MGNHRIQADRVGVAGHVPEADLVPAALGQRVHHSRRSVPKRRQEPVERGWASYNYLVPFELAMYCLTVMTRV